MDDQFLDGMNNKRKFDAYDSSVSLRSKLLRFIFKNLQIFLHDSLAEHALN